MAATAFQDGFSQFFDNSGNPLASGLVYTYAAGTTTPQAAYTTAAGTVAHANPIVLDSAGRAAIFLGQGLSYRIDVKTSAGVLIKSVDNITAGGSAGAEFQSEIQTATDGQTIFNLASISYTPGNSSLKVYEDGVLLELTTDYTETNATRVTLTSGAVAGARFTFWAGADASDSTALDAANIAYTPAGATATNVETRLARTVYVSDYGADGSGDDTAGFQAAIDALPSVGGVIDGEGKSYTVDETDLALGDKIVMWRNFGNINTYKTEAMPGLQVRANLAASGNHQLDVSPDLRVSMRSDLTKIEPALFLTKDATAGVSGMGLAKIQWRGTTSAGTINTDAGRIDSIIVDPAAATFTCVMEVNPNANGNSETQPAMKWQDGVAIPATAALAAITITTAGTGYVAGDVLTVTSTDKRGSGYTTPTVSITGGGGSGATAKAAVSNGGVYSVTVTAAGSGYTSAPTVAFSGGGGSGATATATINADGEVSAITVTAAGTGYTSASASFSGGGGSGAAASPISYDGAVIGAVVTSAGSGYTSQPTISVTGGGGTGAQLFADIVGGVLFSCQAAAGGANASAIVLTVSGGGVTSTYIQDNGYGFVNGEALVFSGGTGSGFAGTAVVPPRSNFFGHGTLNTSRKYILNAETVLEYDYLNNKVDATFNTLELQDQASPAAFGSYGEGVANVATAYYVRNIPVIQYDATSTKARFNRDFGHRLAFYSNTDSPVTADGLAEIVFLNATSGNITFTLPAANFFGTTYGSRIIIKRTDSSGNTVTIQRAGSDTLNGGTSETLSGAAAKTYYSNGGTAWYSH